MLGTNIQHHKVHLIVRMQVTLTDAEGRRWRSKAGHKNEQMVIYCKVFHPQTSNLVLRYNTINNILWHFLDLDVSSWSHLKVKGVNLSAFSEYFLFYLCLLFCLVVSLCHLFFNTFFFFYQTKTTLHQTNDLTNKMPCRYTTILDLRLLLVVHKSCQLE